jgi:hypothetical protein
MVVQVKIPWNRLESVTTVPEAAVVDLDSSPRIFVVDNGRAVEVPVEIVAQVGERVAIEPSGGSPDGDGVSDGAGRARDFGADLVGSQVVIIGQSSLRHGDPVQVSEIR